MTPYGPDPIRVECGSTLWWSSGEERRKTSTGTPVNAGETRD
ncbi:MAG: hypothetical protein Q4C47_02900 [Planctomycetia bacterium]|nr:hypothetical protein [Planctomycetia bacterium]